MCCEKYNWYPKSLNVLKWQLGAKTKDAHNRFYALLSFSQVFQTWMKLKSLLGSTPNSSM